jgi:Prokaryotic RING finger family 1
VASEPKGRSSRELRCPFCRDQIGEPKQAVRCAKCAAPHHQACWEDHGKCTTHACDSTRWLKNTRMAVPRIVVGLGRVAAREGMAHARERLGGKTVVGLFVLTCVLAGLVVSPLLVTGAIKSHPWLVAQAGVGVVFLILWAWIGGLLYRGAHIEDDLSMTTRPLEAYYPHLGGSGSGSGCSDPNCSGADAEGLAVLLLVVLVVAAAAVVLPFVAWVAVELLYPAVVLVIYTVLYGALAFAVNGAQRLAGDAAACAWRGALFALLYTALVCAVVGVALLSVGLVV